MFEYHGWINVLETAGADDEDIRVEEARLRVIADGIQQRITELASPYLLDLLDLRSMNGAVFVHLGGQPNHPAPEILDFFREVGRRAPGSYGLLHVRDDEAAEHGNEVRVLRMVRGEVSEHAEPLLSPCVPVLEDPFPG
ncbi:Imm7 family immunity protein [Kitasatospora sp. NPDC094011]|uniref:Imm7 family immunity protein n=1 Tax=Kitasatospora sp. NPDC094011 TaxID=3364090 RepID=UPI003807EE35